MVLDGDLLGESLPDKKLLEVELGGVECEEGVLSDARNLGDPRVLILDVQNDGGNNNFGVDWGEEHLETDLLIRTELSSD